jgi:hypothetical protein
VNGPQTPPPSGADTTADTQEWLALAELRRYAGWLPYLGAADRDYLHTRRAEVIEMCAEDPARPEWLELYYRWTLTALEAQDPAAALAEAVASDRGKPAEVDRALAALSRTADEWEQSYRPTTGIVGTPYPLTD